MRASALAVLRLIASSSLVGCRTGRSASFAPLRTLGAQLGPKSDIALLLFCAASGLMHCNINASGRTGCVRRSSTCLCLLRGGAGKRSELLTKNEARRIATNTAKLPELLRRRPSWGTPSCRIAIIGSRCRIPKRASSPERWALISLLLLSQQEQSYPRGSLPPRKRNAPVIQFEVAPLIRQIFPMCTGAVPTSGASLPSDSVCRFP